MMKIIELLNQYANLILVAITAIYAMLTWGMVKEMRRVREEEAEPQLLANIIPLGAWVIKLRISNVGRGPAIHIKAKISLEPEKENSTVSWTHPVLLSGSHEDFRLPGDENSNYLDKLAIIYDKLIIELEWHNSFKRRRYLKQEIDLKKQVDGWTKAKFLLRPEDVPVQLGRIKEELSKVNSYLQKQENRQIFQEFKEDEKRQTRKKSTKQRRNNNLRIPANGGRERARGPTPRLA